MKGALPGVAVLLAVLAGCAAPEQAPANAANAIALRNAGFETDPDLQRPCALGWDCTMHADPQSFRFFHDARAPASGKRSFCIEPVSGEPWALVTQGIHDPPFRGATVRLSLAVRVEGASGNGAGPWILIQTDEGRKVHRQMLVNGSHGWQRVEVEVAVPANAQIVEVGATLEGRGRACFDDARLEVVPGLKNPV
jgi:hypothetical protein